MKHLFLASLALAVGITTTSAADNVNFSGEWKLDVAKSHYGPLPIPDKLVRKITHDGSSLTYVDQQVGGYGGDHISTRSLAIDGQSHTVQASGGTAQNTASWEGNELQSDTIVEATSFTYSDRWKLSADGKVLDSTVEILTPRGNIQIKMVFDRQ